MIIRKIKNGLLPILFILLTISISWTYISIKSNPVIPVRAISLSAASEYKIIAKKDVMLWPKGTVFEQGMAAYFYVAAPETYVTPTIKITGLDQGKLEGTIETSVYLQAVNDKAKVYWRHLEQQLPRQSFTFSTGSHKASEQSIYQAQQITLDAALTYKTITDITNELMFQNGEFQLVVSSEISIHGTIHGEYIDKSLSQSLPLTLQPVSFSLPLPQVTATQLTLREGNGKTSSFQAFKNLIFTNPIPFVFNLVLLLFLLLLLFKDNHRLTKSAREHKRYEEWITEGSVEIKDRLSIYIHTLEGLVDLAIDLNKRIIYDSKILKYYVITDDMIYEYDPEHSHALLENREQLGRLLLNRGLIQPKQLEIGLYYHKRTGMKLGKSLIALGYIDETTLYSTLAAQYKIDYYEFHPKTDYINTKLLYEIGLHKARALMALPMKERFDGKLVIACSDATRSGMKESLRELFGTEIHLVASKPSAIFEAFEEINITENNVENNRVSLDYKLPAELLTINEREQFLASYYRGRVSITLFVKAAGLTDQSILNKIPEQEDSLSWLVNKNIIKSEVAALVKGLAKAIEALDETKRREKYLPGLLNLLSEANYLAPKTLEWLHQELALQELPLEQFLINNCLASEVTLKTAGLLLSTLESLLK